MGLFRGFLPRYITMNILFKKDCNPYSPRFIEKCIQNFGKGYNETVCKVIAVQNKLIF